MLTELLDPDAIIIHYPAQDAEDVVRRLSQKLLEKGYVRDSFADAALAREAELPTGLVLGGDINAAIPAVKQEIRRWSLARCRDIARTVLELPTTEAVHRYLQEATP